MHRKDSRTVRPVAGCLVSRYPSRSLLSWLGLRSWIFRSWIFRFWLLLSLVAPARAADPESSDAARAAYASAAALQNREAWDLAAEEWQALQKDHPQDPLALKARYYLGICQLKSEQWPAAAKTLRDVVSSPADGATKALARWELGRGSFVAAQAAPSPAAYAAAAADLREFLDKSPGQPQAADATHFLGEALWQAGRRDEALAAWTTFVKAYADSPRMAEVLYALGVGQAETGKRAEAAITLERFATTFPKHALGDDVALWRADVALATDQPAVAEKVLEPVAAAAGPRAAEALDRLGNARWKQKNWAGAADAFARLARDHATSPLAARATVAAGRGFMEAGRPADARPLLEKAVAGAGAEAFDAAHRLALLELDAKQPARALDIATKALTAIAGRKDADPSLVPKLELDRADALWAIPERRAEAAAAYAAIADRHPDSSAAGPALSMAALAFLDQQQPAQALARADAFLAKHATNSTPGNETALDVRAVRAEALIGLGKTAAAADAYRELVAAAERSPKRPSWQLREAAALAAERQWQRVADLLVPLIPALSGDQQAEARFLAATALVELKRPADAATLLADLEKSSPQWSRREEALLLAVRALRDGGDASAALAAGERLVAQFAAGQNADVSWYRVGQLRQEARRFDDALAAFGKSLAARPDGPRAGWALLASGWCHEGAGRLPEAVRAWTDLVEKHPQSAAVPPALLARADVRQRRGEHEAALADVERLLAEQRGAKPLDQAALGEARLLQGLCLAGTKKYAQAAAAFRRLLAEQPQFAAADRVLFELGVAETLDGKGAEAAATFATLVDRFPKSPHAAEAWLERGEAAWREKRWDEADKAYQGAIAAAAAAPAGRRDLVVEQARHKLGWTRLTQKDHAGAAQAFAAQLAAAPRGAFAVDAQALLGEALLQQGKPADAERAFAAALGPEVSLSSAELRDGTFIRASEAAARQEKWQESLALAERFLAAAPQSPLAPQARYAAAWARQNLGRLDDALAGYRAIADGPRTELAARARLMEGEVLFERGAHKEAVKAFFKVAYGFGEKQAPPAFHPWQAQATFEAARCFEVLKKPEQARGLYAELVERYPDSEHVAAARKRLEALTPRGGS
jgi:TolA-binding protein